MIVNPPTRRRADLASTRQHQESTTTPCAVTARPGVGERSGGGTNRWWGQEETYQMTKNAARSSTTLRAPPAAREETPAFLAHFTYARQMIIFSRVSAKAPFFVFFPRVSAEKKTLVFFWCFLVFLYFLGVFFLVFRAIARIFLGFVFRSQRSKTGRFFSARGWDRILVF